MKILVVGAAGKTGSAVVRRALAEGHEVTAFVHHAAAEQTPGVAVHEGDAADPDAVGAAVAGQDAVIDTVGGSTPYKHTSLEASAAATVITAMRRAGVRRLVATSMIGEGDSQANTPAYDRLLLATFLRGATPDKAEMEREVSDSDLDWVIVRPAILNDDAATGDVRTFSPDTGEKAHKITREDLATFLVAQVTGDEHLRTAVTIANS